MGILTVGRPLTWKEAGEHRAYVREHGITQFIEHYKRNASLSHNLLFYGDEIEYGLFIVDRAQRTSRLSLRGAEVREVLEAREVLEEGTATGKCTWHPEYGAWMVESTPAEPYSGFTSDLRRVETNMRARRARLLTALADDEIAPTVVVFPLLGVPGTSGVPEGVPKTMGPIAQSKYLPDEVINPHPRFGTLTSSIRERRGANVNIEIPLFRDEKTRAESKAIDMDCMAFGMGCCCLQVTFQCRDVDESRHVYDQLAVLAPIMLALTAATPVLKGQVSDWDTRWDVVEMSVDDRTTAERRPRGSEEEEEEEEAATMTGDATKAGKGVRPLATSRYTSAQSFMCADGRCAHCPAEFYNDVQLEIDEEAKLRLLGAGIDDVLASHVAHLFVRDPLVLFEGLVREVDDTQATDHFENLQSTNWNSVRWKPPPANGATGWRVELRTMEVQLTDFENAAYTVFSTLALRVLLSFNLDIYAPMSKVHANMRTARERDAITKGRFWWRSRLADPKITTAATAGTPEEKKQQHHHHNHHQPPCDDASTATPPPPPPPPPPPSPAETTTECPRPIRSCQACEQMSLSEILLGKDGYVGLVPLIYAYLDFIGCDPAARQQVKVYLDLIIKRASGELMTAAKWMRSFVHAHPDYQRDSTVSQAVATDLLAACHDIGVGKLHVPKLIGDKAIRPIVKENAYNVQLSRVHIDSTEELTAVLDRYSRRARLVQRRTDLVNAARAKQDELAELQRELTEVEADLGLSSDLALTEATKNDVDRVRTDADSISVHRKSPSPPIKSLNHSKSLPAF